jgi:predicted SAM-dependent methyltransferase
MYPMPHTDPPSRVLSRFPVKLTADGKAMLNIACGVRTHHAWNNMDFSPYTRLAARPLAAKLLHSVGILSNLRYDRVKRVDPAIISWDLRNGIPFPDDTFDIVYHSHFLEHLDRSVAPIVLLECRRAVKPGGFIRVVVPDLQILVQQYTEALAALERSHADAAQLHHRALYQLFDQMVRTESAGTAQQRTWVRRIERKFRNAASTGELHKWMYDRYSLAALLEETGFRDPTVRKHDTSAHPRWRDFGLDTEPDGTPYKKHSLYIEAFK